MGCAPMQCCLLPCQPGPWGAHQPLLDVVVMKRVGVCKAGQTLLTWTDLSSNAYMVFFIHDPLVLAAWLYWAVLGPWHHSR